MLKEKLLSEYLNYDFVFEDKSTPLRRFVDSIGLDHTKMNRKQMDKWARTKRYKEFFGLMKIKRIADEANIKESVIFYNLDLFLSNFEPNLSEETTITEEETLNFLKILEVAMTPPPVKLYSKTGKRGKYKSLSQRKSILKQHILNTVNKGGSVSLGGGILFAGTGKHSKHAKKALTKGRVLLKKRVRTPIGMRYHRKVYQTPKGF